MVTDSAQRAATIQRRRSDMHALPARRLFVETAASSVSAIQRGGYRMSSVNIQPVLTQTMPRITSAIVTIMFLFAICRVPRGCKLTVFCCFLLYLCDYCAFLLSVYYMFLQNFDTVGWVF